MALRAQGLIDLLLSAGEEELRFPGVKLFAGDFYSGPKSAVFDSALFILTQKNVKLNVNDVNIFAFTQHKHLRAGNCIFVILFFC